MATVYFTINATCSFNCSTEIDGPISKSKLAEMINSLEILPHIESEITYNFHGRSIYNINFTEDETFYEMD